MEVTKTQIAKGLSRFIQEDMLPHVDDRGMQFVLGVASGTIDANPQVLDKLLDNPLLAMAAKSGNNYDLSTLKRAASSAIEKYGKLEITVPGIKFISPADKVFQFSKEDVEKLVSRIEGS